MYVLLFISFNLLTKVLLGLPIPGPKKAITMLFVWNVLEGT